MNKWKSGTIFPQTACSFPLDGAEKKKISPQGMFQVAQLLKCLLTGWVKVLPLAGSFSSVKPLMRIQDRGLISAGRSRTFTEEPELLL